MEGKAPGGRSCAPVKAGMGKERCKMAVFVGLVFLWLLATPVVNPNLEGDRRKGSLRRS